MDRIEILVIITICVCIVLLGCVITCLFYVTKPCNQDKKTDYTKIQDELNRYGDDTIVSDTIVADTIGADLNAFIKMMCGDSVKYSTIQDSNNPDINELYFHNLDKSMYLFPNYNYVQINKWKKTKDLFSLCIDGEPNFITKEARKKILVVGSKVNACDLYLPFYALFCLFAEKDLHSLCASSLETGRTSLKDWKSRDFCFYAYSNYNSTRFQGVSKRRKFYQIFTKMCPGRIHNYGGDGVDVVFEKPKNQKGSFPNNDQLMKRFKFVIAFENEELDGWISEKMVNPLFAGAIPIYMGAPDVSKQFNPDCFINVSNYLSFEDCIEDIIKIEQDTERLQKMLSTAPINSESCGLDFLRKYKSQFWTKMYDLLPIEIQPIFRISRILNNLTHFITFVQDKQSYRICKEALSCGYFHTVQAFSTDSWPLEIDIKHLNFIAENPRLQGYAVWKSIIIYSKLISMNDEEVLVYADSGYHINPYKNKYFKESYIDILEDVLGFETKYQELPWCKQKAINGVANYLNLPHLDSLVTGNQISSSLIILKKTERTMKFLLDWKNLCSKYELIDDSPSVNEHDVFIENRHDQTIFSLLMKHYGMQTYKDGYTKIIHTYDE